MPDWQITAKTLLCPAVDGEVTVMVYKDLTAKCTGFGKYTADSLQKKSRKLGRKLGCAGLDCDLIRQYREHLVQEGKQVAR